MILKKLTQVSLILGSLFLAASCDVLPGQTDITEQTSTTNSETGDSRSVIGDAMKAINDAVVETGHYWKNVEHDCPQLVSVTHNCVRMAPSKVPVVEWYWQAKNHTCWQSGGWSDVYWYTDWWGNNIYRKEWVAANNVYNCNEIGEPHKYWTSRITGYNTIQTLQTFYGDPGNCGGLELAAHKQLRILRTSNCGLFLAPHQAWVPRIDPTFRTSLISDADFTYDTANYGHQYCQDNWGTWGFHGDDPWSNAWFGDYKCSHAVFSDAGCGDMKSISYVVPVKGTKDSPLRDGDLTSDLVAKYGLGATRIQLWMGDYEYSPGWGTGAEICIYTLVKDDYAWYYAVPPSPGFPGRIVRPGAKWIPQNTGEQMEFVVENQPKGTVILSTSRNDEKPGKTWWLNRWQVGGVASFKGVHAQDLNMYFRIQGYWEGKWMKWDGNNVTGNVIKAL